MTMFKEIGRNHCHGYWEILWHCRVCGHNVSLPQQQNFSYCLHCGRKVVRKIGGNVSVEENIELANAICKQKG